MTVAAAPPAVPAPVRPARAGLRVWQAPLVPVAVAASAGIVIDRRFDVPLTVSLAAALASLLAFVLYGFGPRRLLGLLYLWAGAAALAGAYHHWYRGAAGLDDLRHLAAEEGYPARLRGVIESQPVVAKGTGPDPLRNFPRKDATRFLLRVSAAQDLASRTWHPASGLVEVRVGGAAAEVSLGDAVEMPGRLALPEGPANPGEFDYATYLRDRQVSALLSVPEGRDVEVRGRAGRMSPWGWLAAVRGWGQNVLAGAIPSQGDLAAALLLGDSPGMTADDWDLYQRTGVIHVLAISGQHLVVLAGFIAVVLQLARVPRRRGVLIVAASLMVYALLAGGRPPVMRSAWVMAAAAGAVLLRRPIHRGNTFALAWLLVALCNPTDLFNAGCQLSFLAVAVLVWGIPDLSDSSALFKLRLFGNPDVPALGPDRPGGRDALQQVIEDSRPFLQALVFRALRDIGYAYVLNALVWLAVTPLVATHYHLVSPVALLIGPPLVLLTSIALFAGFGVLLLNPVGWPLAWPFTMAARWSLAGCEGLTRLGAGIPGAYFYVLDVPAWWAWAFYLALLAGLGTGLVRRHALPALALMLGWLGLGVVLLLAPHRPGEFRCAFLAVGHGGCAVIETPGGRVLLYDAGSIAGPDLTRRHIAPYLWSRGIRRIDEVILSHAGLDHFNGIPDLVDRFAVGRITCTPTFAQRDLHAVRVALAAVERRGIPTRVVSAGDRWEADGLALEVLHPPADGPDGKENVRSLVLLLRHGGLSILLTGDLEEAGLTRVLAQPPRQVDVMMAPHHGSAKANTPPLAGWASPRLVVICQGAHDNTAGAAKTYAATGAAVYGTWPHGAVTVRQAGAWVETFRSRLARPLREGND
jgi:competence protein ComEC